MSSLDYRYHGEEGYIQLLWDILQFGSDRSDRTGVGTISLFNPATLVFWDVENDFPLITTKKMAWKSILAETLWFAQGRFDLESLRADGCKWWDDWEREDGTLGRPYGAQLRHWIRPDGSEFDQLAWVLNEIKTNPTSRRLVMTMWNAGELDNMALPPCHGALIQVYVADGSLDMHMNIRSSDTFLGLPTNIAGYALLLKMMAHETGLVAGSLRITLGDAHIYANHVDAVKELISRTPHGPYPQVTITSDTKEIDSLRPENFTLTDYYPRSAIPAPIAV